MHKHCQTVSITDQHSGAIRQAQIFVAVLGASNYTFLEATWGQQLPGWIGSHVRAKNFYGGTTELWVPDNLRIGVTKASRYEPDNVVVDTDACELPRSILVGLLRQGPQRRLVHLGEGTGATSWHRHGAHLD